MTSSKTMTKILAAAALVSAMAIPAMAQDIPYGANGRTGAAAYYGNQNGYAPGFRNHAGYRGGYYGGAPSYGYGGSAYDSYASDYVPVYREHRPYRNNGFVCTPGTVYVNGNGHTQICQ